MAAKDASAPKLDMPSSLKGIGLSDQGVIGGNAEIHMDIMIARGGKTYGPYSEEQIRDLLAKRSITVFDDAWMQGLPNWMKLHQVLEALEAKQGNLPVPEKEPEPPKSEPLVKQDSFDTQGKQEIGDQAEGGKSAKGGVVAVPRGTASSSQRIRDQEDFSVQLKSWLIRKGFHVGLPAKGVDTTGAALGATLAFFAVKLAYRIFAKRSLHAHAHVGGVTATPEDVKKALSSLPPTVDILAIRNDFMHGGGAFFALFSDELSSGDLLASLNGLADTALELAKFSMISNGRQEFFARPLVVHFDSSAYESHLATMARAGWLKKDSEYSETSPHLRMAISHASFIDIPRRIVEFSSPSGFFGKARGIFWRPFSLKQLREVLAEPIVR